MNIAKRIKIIYGFSLLLILMSLMTGCPGCGPVSTGGKDTKALAPKALQIVEAGLADRDPRVRTNAIEVAATTGTLDLMPRVSQMLTDEFIPVRFAAALAVGDTKYGPAKLRLEQILKASDENTALAVSYALYMLGDKTKFSNLTARLSNKDMNIRANAVLLLGKANNKEAINLLQLIMDARDSDDKVRFQAAESLARLGDESVYPKLWTMALSINADIRVIGAMAMGALGTEQARGALTTLLSDPVVEVRLVAAEQLGKLGFPTGEPEVLDVVAKNLTAKMDPISAERVNSLAAPAIGQIKTPSVTKYLPILLNNDSKFVKLAAAKAVLLCQ